MRGDATHTPGGGRRARARPEDAPATGAITPTWQTATSGMLLRPARRPGEVRVLQGEGARVSRVTDSQWVPICAAGAGQL